jgi:O-antigen/teichoic acid export membrane protein
MSTDAPLRSTALRGLGWLTGAQGARQLLQFGLRVLLVRLLAPEDFGLLAMVTVFSGLVLILADLGLGPALVREETVGEEELSTVFWLNAATGCLLAGLTAALGPALAEFYRQPRLTPLCVALALGSWAGPLVSVPQALLQRRLAFARLARVEVLAMVAGGIVGVLLAARGWGVWSLVWQSNTVVLASLLAGLWEARWLPARRPRPAAVNRLWRVGGHLTAASVLNYGVRNLDNLLIGRFLGPVSLGYYSQAYQLMLVPVQNVTAVAGRMMFPTLASLQAEPARLRRGYLSAVSGIAAVTFPLMLGAVVMAPDLYAVLFGPRWERSVPLFQVLCGLGMLQSIGATVGWIYMATGRTDLMLRWNLLTVCLVLPGFLLGLRWGGLEGLTIGYALTSGLLFVPSLAAACSVLHLPLGEVARRLAPWLGAAAGMALTVAAARWLMLAVLTPAPPPGSAALTRLLACALLGGIAYPALLHALGQAPIRRATALLGSLRAPK